MATAEQISSSLYTIREAQSIGEPGTIPVEWTGIADQYDEIVSQDSALVVFHPAGLRALDVEEMSPGIYHSVIHETLTRMGIDKPVSKIRTTVFQAGKKAIILFNEAVTSTKSGYFITYLSREPIDTDIGRETQEDFNNLSVLSDAFDTKLKTDARRKYSIIKPHSYGTTEFRGREYPLFTMPYVPMNELRLDAFPDYSLIAQTGVTPVLTYPRYAFPIDPRSLRITEQQMQMAKSHGMSMLHISPSLIATPEALKRIAKLPNTVRIKAQMDDIVRGEALMYLLSGGRVPEEHMLNAGDWMGEINGANLTLKLITVRGGWSRQLSPDRWIDYMRQHQEVLPGSENTLSGSIMFLPFWKYTPNDLTNILNQAQNLIKW